MKKFIVISLVIIIALGFALANSKKKAEQVAWPLMEQCWNDGNIQVFSLSVRPSFREGFNWCVGVISTEKGFDAILENPKYGDVPEILVSILGGKVVWKHFTEIDEPKVGCGNI